MSTLLYNINPDWRFDELCHRHAMDWHPAGEEGVRVWDLGRPGIGPRPSLPWPDRVAPAQALARLDDLALCAGGMPSAFVVCAPESDLADGGVVQEMLQQLRSCERRILFLLGQEIAPKTRQRCRQLLDQEAFTYVALCSEPTEKACFAVLRVLVEQVNAPNREDQEGYPFALRQGPDDRLLRIVIEDEGERDRLGEAFCCLAGQLRRWAQKWKESESAAWKTPLETLKGEVALLRKTEGKNREDEPSPGLPEVPLFWDATLEPRLQGSADSFDDRLDEYLEDWFKALNQAHDERKRASGEKFRSNLNELREMLAPSVSIRDRDLDDALASLEEEQQALVEALRGHLETIRTDLTPRSRRRLRWRGDKNRGFERQYFREPEEAVARRLKEAQTAVAHLADPLAFAWTLVGALLLAALPVAILRGYFVPPAYWGSPAMGIDALWTGIITAIAATWLLVFAIRRRRAARRALNGLGDSLGQLLVRHQEVFKNTDAYLAKVLAKRQLFQIVAELEKAREEHRDWREFVDDLEGLLAAQCPSDRESAGDAPEPLPAGTPADWWKAGVTGLMGECALREVAQSDERRSGALPSLWSRGLGDGARVSFQRVEE